MGAAALAALAALPGCNALLDAGDYHVTATTDASAADAADGPLSCVRNADCTSVYGSHFFCKQSEHRCQSLLSEDCQRVLGDDSNDDAIVFGSILPLEGADQSTGRTIENAIALALDDFQRAGNVVPVPGDTRRRPVAIVSCDDRSAGELAERAANHLVANVGVPAIIGGAFSDLALRIATQVAIPSRTLLISPSATSTALTNLADSGFVWRTCPSDVHQADAYVALMPVLEADFRERHPDVDKVRVAVVHKGDGYGVGLADATLRRLAFNGSLALSVENAFNLRRIDYGDPHNPRKLPRFEEAELEVAEFAPDVVFLLGTTETITDLLPGIERIWSPSRPRRPQYVMGDGSLIDETWKYLAENDPDSSLRRRIVGTVPGTEGENAQAFRHHYAATFRDGTSGHTAGAANAYDAVYNLIYAAVAAGADPLDGRNLGIGFGRQVPPGELLAAGGANINTAFRLLSEGKSFDFDGASGPLDYDLATGEAVSDIQVWCVPLMLGEPTYPSPSGVRYDAVTRSLVGTMATIRSACQF